MKKIFKYVGVPVLILLALFFFKDKMFPREEESVGQLQKSLSNEEKQITKHDKEGLSKDKKRIYMVLWSGPTEIEKGFQSYFKENKIDADYTIRDCKGDAKVCHELVKEIKEAKPDLIYTWGTPAATAIAGPIDAPNKNEYIWDIPIVSTIVGNPIFSKIIYDLAKPGRNVTGVNHVPSFEAQLNSMLSYSTFKKVAIFYVPSEVPTIPHVENFKKECETKGIEAVCFPYPYLVNNKLDPSKLDNAFQTIKDAGIDIVYLPPSNYLSIDAHVVCEAAHKHNILTFVATELMLTNGPPLMGLISSYINIGRFAAEKAAHILVEGKDPKTLPYERFEKFSFFIAKKVMQQLQIYPPVAIVDQAHFIDK